MTDTRPATRPSASRRWTLAELARSCSLSLLAAPVPGAAAQGDGVAPEDVLVAGIALDNRRLVPGEIFAGLPGQHVHGASHAAAAAAAGATAILTDTAGASHAVGSGLPVLVPAPDVPLRVALANVAAELTGRPTTRLRTFAVTGTNGKTTTTFLLAHVLGLLGRHAGLVGTIELRVGGHAEPARLTTPESPELHALAAAMLEAGDDDLVMEVSSHALVQHRVGAVVFDVAGFTHLTPDHLDYHGDLESYFAAKAALFTPAHARSAVVLVDDEWGRRLAATATVPVTTVRTRPDLAAAAGDGAADGAADWAGDWAADWSVTDVTSHDGGTRFTLRAADASLTTSLALPGDFNVSNAALALVMVLAAGHRVEDVQRALDAAGGITAQVPGRMEVVASRPRCVVDFAHNADALGRALATLRGTTAGRLHVVFGATGDRDRAKRPEMGEVAARGADVVVLTDDDPHGEDPAAVRAEVAVGIDRAIAAGAVAQVHEIGERAAAISYAVTHADPQDTVLVAGRGHETVQEVAGVDQRLDDRVEVRAALGLAASDGASS